MRDDKKTTIGRRDFLRATGAVGAGVALATPIISPARADKEGDDAKRKARYRESDDVKAFYRVNRYPR